MAKRNFVLLIIFLIIALLAVFGYFYFNQEPTGTENSGGGTNFLARFNPFGSNPTTPTTTNPTEVVDLSEPTPDSINEVSIEKLRKISSMPVAGFELLIKERLKDIPVVPTNITTPEIGTTPPKVTTKPNPPPTELVSATRYVERSTGNIFQTFLDKIEEVKFSTTIILKIQEAFFGNKDASVIMRYLKSDEKTIQTFLGAIPKEILGSDTENNEIKGTFLADNITDMSISPDATKMFYLLNVEDTALGTVLTFTGETKTLVFDSPFTEWLSFWPNANMITLTTKPSANVPGYMYAINPTTKSFTRILGEINGLTTLTSPDGKLVLYGNNNLSLSVYNITEKTSISLGVNTLPEKCVWSSGSDMLYCAVPSVVSPGQYPDSWYQGEVSFVDQLWKIDIASGLTTMLGDPTTLRKGEDVDAIKLALDKSEKYLLFINKRDSFLWKLNLE